VYAANGPNLITNDPNASGQLNFNDYTDLNNNKVFGGRIGFLPFPDMEMGYSLQFHNQKPSGFQKVRAFLQAADYHYKPTIVSLGGQFDFSAEWIWSESRHRYLRPDRLMGFGPTRFNNSRQGGYVSLAFTAPPWPTTKSFRILSSWVRYAQLGKSHPFARR